MSTSIITIFEDAAKITVSDNETSINVDYTVNEITLAREGHIIILQSSGE